MTAIGIAALTASTFEQGPKLVWNASPSVPVGFYSIAGGEFDVILLDWQLPDMEGISILEQYRSGDGKAKVVMLTGMRDKADEVIKLGADEFLAKPFKMHEVLNMLERVTT